MDKIDDFKKILDNIDYYKDSNNLGFIVLFKYNPETKEKELIIYKNKVSVDSLIGALEIAKIKELQSSGLI